MTDQGDHRGSRSRGTASDRSRRVLLTGGALLLFAVAMLAVAVSGRPTFDLAPSTPPPLPQRSPAPSTTPQSGDGALPPLTGNDTFLRVLGIILSLLVAVLILAGLVLLIRRLLRAWADRPLRKQEGADVDVDLAVDASAEAMPDAPTVRRGIAAAREAIDRRIAPGDAIIAAWLGLEETAADAGAGRGTSETPAEFMLRILRHRPGIEKPTNQLLRLYEGVRFGAHAVGESDRATAADALAAIEEAWR